MNAPLYLAELSEWHLLLIGFVILLLFGGKKLPELARGMGEAMKEFKRASRDDAPSTSAPKDTTTSHNDKTTTGSSSGGSSS